MKNTFGNNVTLTIFGESHGASVGCVIDGLAPGIPVKNENIEHYLSLRRPAGDISTARREEDPFIIHSGVFEGHTTGTPICITIPNGDTRSADYSPTRFLARPSHADYTANCKYGGFEDYRGGGHQSGRITAALCAAAGILLPALERKGITVGSHIASCGGVSDRPFSLFCESEVMSVKDMPFAVLDSEAGERMKEAILAAKRDGDSVGGVIETAVCGLDAGLGEPWFDSLESLLSHAVFSVPGIKGIEFGAGFALSSMRGSEANDCFVMSDGAIVTDTNNAGGINGGISNGMPIIFRSAVRPTPTLSREQKTVDFKEKTDALLASKGRHDPCIVHRARVVVDAVTALVLCDSLAGRYGTDWLAK